MSGQDLDDKLKKNQKDNLNKSQDAKDSASSFFEDKNQNSKPSKDALLEKIENKSKNADADKIIINNRAKTASKPELTIQKNTRNQSQAKFEEPIIPQNTRHKISPTEDTPIPKNTRGQIPTPQNTRNQIPTPKNTRKTSTEIDTSNVKNTRASITPTPQNTTQTAFPNSRKKAKSANLNINNLTPEMQSQFAQFLNQANASGQNNFPNFDPNAFNVPNFNPSDIPNFNPNDFGAFNPNEFPNFNPNDFQNPNFTAPNDFAGSFEDFAENKPNEQQGVQTNTPSTPPRKPNRPTPPPKPAPQTQEAITPTQQDVDAEDQIPDIEIPEFTAPESLEDFEAPEIPEAFEPIEDIPNIEEIPEITPEAPSEPATQSQPQSTAPTDFLFEAEIPESEQRDIRALVDISLEKNTEAVLLAQNINDASATLGQAAEDLIGNKMKRNVKGWLVALGIILLITGALAYFWDSIFGKEINQEQAAGLTLIVVPNESNTGGLDTRYTFYPGSEIQFQDGVKVGSDRYRTEIREDGTEIQEENEAFAFRFRFCIEFLDEENVDYPELIDEVVFPAEIQNAIKYDEASGFYYYYNLVYPGEKYITFAYSVIISTQLNNDYQGREFMVVLEYKTIVPENLDVMLAPSTPDPDGEGTIGGMPDAPSDWIAQMVEQFNTYMQNRR